MIPQDENIKKHLDQFGEHERAIFSSYLAEEMEKGLNRAGLFPSDEDEIRTIFATRVTTYNDRHRNTIWWILDQGRPTQAWVCGADYKNMKILRPTSKKRL